MKKILPLSILASGMISITSCHQHSTTIVAASETIKEQNLNRKIYSKNVGDSFSVSIMLPRGYDTAVNKRYPVMYILDANLYFDIIATAVRKYNEIGFPPVILVGIGYNDFESMDSLRNRDYTYPKAFPEYEMSASGGEPKSFCISSMKNSTPLLTGNTGQIQTTGHWPGIRLVDILFPGFF